MMQARAPFQTYQTGRRRMPDNATLPGSDVSKIQWSQKLQHRL
jgi:hypothetical protein